MISVNHPPTPSKLSVGELLLLLLLLLLLISSSSKQAGDQKTRVWLVLFLSYREKEGASEKVICL